MVNNVTKELQVLTEYKNTFFVDILSAYQNKTSLFLITKFISSDNLKVILQKKIFSESESKFIICNLICCLNYLHEKKFLIMKINPENILINDDGYIKVTNFNACINMNELNVETFNLNFVTNYTAPEIFYR